MTSDHLFVYGTLRGESSHEMASLLRQHAQFVSRATYQGRLYKIDWYPGVIPSEDPQDQVQGDLYQLEEPEILLKQLDRYEECDPGFSKPTEYIRIIQAVRDPGGKTVAAWIYLYNWSVEQCEWIRSGDFLR